MVKRVMVGTRQEVIVMSEEVLFDIEFKGRFSNKIDKPTAIANFAKLFKLPEQKAALFFDGKSRTLKKSLNMEKASQFRAVLKKAHLRVSMKKQIDESAAKEQAITMSSPGVVIIEKAFVPPVEIDAHKFEIDQVGTEIVEEQHIAEPQIDISNISVDEVGVDIVKKVEVAQPQIDTSSLSMDEVGAVFAQKPNIPEPVLDISAIDMEEVGATIVEKKIIPKPDINTDNIKISDD